MNKYPPIVGTGKPEFLYLYHLFDKDGRLLYVGVTRDPFKRFASHKNTQAWADRIHYFTAKSHPYEDIFAIEQLAIKKHKPPFNKVHNTPTSLVTQKKLQKIKHAQFIGSALGTVLGGYLGNKHAEQLNAATQRKLAQR